MTTQDQAGTVTKGLLVRIEAMDGREEEVQSFLRVARLTSPARWLRR